MAHAQKLTAMRPLLVERVTTQPKHARLAWMRTQPDLGGKTEYRIAAPNPHSREAKRRRTL